MGKPSFTVFAGVNDLSPTDIEKLGPELRKAYARCDEYDASVVTVNGLKFSSFDLGRSDTADPAEFAGFGVHVYGEWYSTGVIPFVLEDFAQAGETVQKVQKIFDDLGLQVGVKLLCFCGYGV